ncbi:MAG: beta-glucuronidase [Candidatus Marinimicrobia bacterium]|jgi:beta-glucuronidase|nr:beta-glucuronidase [Candidatus Neomarinimicrobiota bacterium]MBT3633587.1 beta-glucuronidase [Candidatus Neomarinimicrobiota bacterium]MBT3682460.1 beta-glucuronidase [Candidatus Neomarinimicrobiota bacterium]MBT3759224.1 beta-glucuronidase [Candidatus Neomarinimicrobiota bacterium]MBT3895503.1 beta-glucuronidase [Candidatus Neomarinimicrobiota bacterium]
MKILTLIMAILLSVTEELTANDQLLINAYNRSSQSLDGQWNYIIDPYENGYYNYRYEPFEKQKYPGRGAFFLNSKSNNKSDLIEYDFDKSETISVPGDWNTQKKELLYYEGTVWYKKSFDYIKSNKTNRVFVYFGASNYETDVYLNGVKLGNHVGGFTPFNYDITDLITDEGNFLIVKVDNKRKKEGVPTLNTDWWNYGGLTRSVKIIETNEIFIRDYIIQLDSENPEKIKGYVKLSGESIYHNPIKITIPELGVDEKVITNKDGVASIDIVSDNIRYWSVKDPHLYKVKIHIQEDEVVDYIGFRIIKTEGKFILLNGEQVFLKGISIHEESPIRQGRAHSKDDALQLLTWAKELGCNFVRLAHYPHNEHMIRLADQLGILVWEEIPVYWTIDWENESTYENAEHQLSTVIHRDKNRASVIIWSMANETPTSKARNSFLNRLAVKAKQLDSTRLISAALEQSSQGGDGNIRTITDPFADVVDVLSFNEYLGWYDGLPEKCRDISWIIKQDKPVIISEFGGGAKYGLHGDKSERWTEEYQEFLYEENLKMISKIDQLQGISPWILIDFKSPRRPLPEIQDGWNRKGLISEDGHKKKAFYVLKEYYESK